LPLSHVTKFLKAKKYTEWSYSAKFC
jgi:hypothetical protein